ncbi:MAG: hypothetical protein KDC38_15200, partial [Planctomycetes bacterium]|nr:hypothetical protein [Planctomycetota bacterium]
MNTNESRTRRLGTRVATAAIAALAIASILGPFVPVGHAEIIHDGTPLPAVGELGSPSRSLTPLEEEQFLRGRKLFDRDWKLGQGLGADLNGDSCRACHQDPVIGGSGGLDVNVFRFARDEGGLGPLQE